jgi:hypothetical protein
MMISYSKSQARYPIIYYHKTRPFTIFFLT